MKPPIKLAVLAAFMLTLCASQAQTPFNAVFSFTNSQSQPLQYCQVTLTPIAPLVTWSNFFWTTNLITGPTTDTNGTSVFTNLYSGAAYQLVLINGNDVVLNTNVGFPNGLTGNVIAAPYQGLYNSYSNVFYYSITNWNLQTIAAGSNIVFTVANGVTTINASGGGSPFIGVFYDTAGTNQTGTAALTNLSAGNGSGLTNLPAVALTGLSSNHMIYVATWGNDATGQRGNSALPYKTLYAWSGSGAPTGVLTIATNGDTVVIYPGTYYAPAFPIFTAGVSIIGVGQPTVYRTNSGAGQCDASVAGPFVQPNTGLFMSGMNFVATNAVVGTGFIDIAFGMDASVAVSSTQATAGFTNNFIATNWLVQNCTFTGMEMAVYTSSSAIPSVGVTNTGTFISDIFNAGWQCFYIANNNSSVLSYEVFNNVGCTYNITANTNGLMGATFLGIAVGLHISENTSGLETQSPCTIYDTGGVITLFGTNNTIAPKLCFVEEERNGGQFILNGTRYVLATNQVAPLLGFNFGGQMVITTPTNVNGLFYDTNNYANIVNLLVNTNSDATGSFPTASNTPVRSGNNTWGNGSNTFTGQTTFTGAVTNIVAQTNLVSIGAPLIYGSAANMTTIPAAQLSGQVPSANITNVALLNAASNTYNATSTQYFDNTTNSGNLGVAGNITTGTVTNNGPVIKKTIQLAYTQTNIDWSTGEDFNYPVITTNGTTIFSFTNWPSSTNNNQTIILKVAVAAGITNLIVFTNGGTYTMHWPNNIAPVQSTNGYKDIYPFYYDGTSTNGSNIIYGVEPTQRYPWP